jgi:hypothetical protein
MKDFSENNKPKLVIKMGQLLLSSIGKKRGGEGMHRREECFGQPVSRITNERSIKIGLHVLN